MNNPYPQFQTNIQAHAKEYRLLPAEDGWQDFKHHLPRFVSEVERSAIEKIYREAHAVNYVEPIANKS